MWGLAEEIVALKEGVFSRNFDVLLTVHLSIILAINELNAQNLLL